MIPAIATKKPTKKLVLSLSSLITKRETIAVKNGATDMITPTFAASVKVNAMFSNK